jgi:hypothetical protein
METKGLPRVLVIRLLPPVAAKSAPGLQSKFDSIFELHWVKVSPVI